jgi:hypothetical protein
MIPRIALGLLLVLALAGAAAAQDAEDAALLENRARDAIDAAFGPAFDRGAVCEQLAKIGRLDTANRLILLDRLLEYVNESIDATSAQIDRAAAVKLPARGEKLTEAQLREIDAEKKRIEILARRLEPLLQAHSDILTTMKASPDDADISLRDAYFALSDETRKRHVINTLSDISSLSSLLNVEADEYLVSRIARRLGEMGSASDAAVAALLRHASNFKATRRCRSECMNALGKVAGPSAVPGLIKLLKDPLMKDSAHAALVRITGNDRGTEPGNWAVPGVR